MEQGKSTDKITNSSERPELSSPSKRNTAGRYPVRAGFPPGFTVDELCLFRKKKPPGYLGPKDNLKPEEGSMKKIKSEYKRSYKKYDILAEPTEDLPSQEVSMQLEMETVAGQKNRRRRRKPKDLLKLEGSISLDPEYSNLYIQHPLSKDIALKPISYFDHGDGSTDLVSEQHETYIPFQGPKRAELTRRCHSLHREGDFQVRSSETHSQFHEYEGARRAELTRRPTSLRLEGVMSTDTETAEKFIEFLIEQRPELARIQSSLKLEGTMSNVSEKTDKYIPFNIERRVPLVKQATNLHMEGTMETQTEKQDKYVPFNVQERPKLMKKDTNLHLEGVMETTTEKNDKYIAYDLPKKEPLMKRSTNLHLEGVMDVQSEKNAKYVQYEMQKRPPLVKKDTNLHLEGDLMLIPEYKDVYVEYTADRPKPIRPINNLHASQYEETTDKLQKDDFFLEYMKPYRNGSTSHIGMRTDLTRENLGRSDLRRPKENLKPEGVIDLTTENQQKYMEHQVSKPSLRRISDNLLLEGALDINPEYRQKYVSFPAERPKAVRPAEELSQDLKQKRTRKYAQPIGHLRSEGCLDGSPEYRSNFVEFPRERPVLRRPASHLRPEGHVSHVSEKESQYIEYSYMPRPALAKREDAIRVEGRFECQPEYRKAYIDYLMRENIERKPRPFDNLVIDTQKEPEIEKKESNGTETESSSKSQSDPEKPKPTKPTKQDKNKQNKSKKSTEKPSPTPPLREVPRTPRQQKVLVPDLSTMSRRPSSIFGPKTTAYRCRDGSPHCKPIYYSEEECEDNWRPERNLKGSLSRSCSPQRIEIPRVEVTPARRSSPSSPERRKWGKDHRREEKPASFVVLQDGEGGKRGSRVREQKWMPPWYGPPI